MAEVTSIKLVEPPQPVVSRVNPAIRVNPGDSRGNPVVAALMLILETQNAQDDLLKRSESALENLERLNAAGGVAANHSGIAAEKMADFLEDFHRTRDEIAAIFYRGIEQLDKELVEHVLIMPGEDDDSRFGHFLAMVRQETRESINLGMSDVQAELIELSRRDRERLESDLAAAHKQIGKLTDDLAAERDKRVAPKPILKPEPKLGFKDRLFRALEIINNGK